MAATLPVSVVISTYDEGCRLRETISSVLEAAEQPSQIVIVDDGSTDTSCGGVWPPAVTVLRRPHRGIAPARNDGVAAATQPLIVILDAHCAVDRHWLRPLCDALARYPRALVGPAMADTGEPAFVGCGATIVNPIFEYKWNAVPSHGIGRVQVVPGGCLGVRREIFLAAGGFGPFKGFGVEDVDLALRWHAAGRPVLGVPHSKVLHRFRTQAPYRPEHRHYLENVLRTALRHLTGERLRTTVLACAQYPTFAPALAEVLVEMHERPSEAHRDALERVLESSAAWQ